MTDQHKNRQMTVAVQLHLKMMMNTSVCVRQQTNLLELCGSLDSEVQENAGRSVLVPLRVVKPRQNFWTLCVEMRV